MDLISRRAAIDAADKIIKRDTSGNNDVVKAMTAWKSYIEKLPSTQPKRTGKWIPVDSYTAFGGDKVAWHSHGNPIAFYYCSECKKQAYADENGDSLLTNFCPNCGKPMKMEETV